MQEHVTGNQSHMNSTRSGPLRARSQDVVKIRSINHTVSILHASTQQVDTRHHHKNRYTLAHRQPTLDPYTQATAHTHLEVLDVSENTILDHLDGGQEAGIVVLEVLALSAQPGDVICIHTKDEQVLLARLLQSTPNTFGSGYATHR
jgi:hypothetical protein